MPVFERSNTWRKTTWNGSHNRKTLVWHESVKNWSDLKSEPRFEGHCLRLNNANFNTWPGLTVLSWAEGLIHTSVIVISNIRRLSSVLLISSTCLLSVINVILSLRMMLTIMITTQSRTYSPYFLLRMLDEIIGLWKTPNRKSRFWVSRTCALLSDLVNSKWRTTYIEHVNA